MKIIPYIILVILLLGPCGRASAHETVENGTVSMTIHIDPDEIPIPGKVSTIQIDLENKEKSFSFEKCNCVLNIGQDGKILKTVTLSKSSTPSIFSFNPVQFTFPTVGKYDLTVSGSPQTPGLFTPFEVDYDTDVGVAENTPSSSHSHDDFFDLTNYILLGIAVLGTIYVFIDERTKKNKSKV